MKTEITALDAWGNAHTWQVSWKPVRATGADPAADNVGETAVLWDKEPPVILVRDSFGGVDLEPAPREHCGWFYAPEGLTIREVTQP